MAPADEIRFEPAARRIGACAFPWISFDESNLILLLVHFDTTLDSRGNLMEIVQNGPQNTLPRDMCGYIKLITKKQKEIALVFVQRLRNVFKLKVCIRNVKRGTIPSIQWLQEIFACYCIYRCIYVLTNQVWL